MAPLKTELLILMKAKLLPILFISCMFAGELEVEGDLTVTGTIQSTTIDSLLQVIAQLQAQIALLQSSSGFETRVYELGTLDVIAYQTNDIVLDVTAITGYELENFYINFHKVNNFKKGCKNT